MEDKFMHETVNPYQSPETDVNPEKPLLSHGSITETMLLHLKKASPWMRFVGIVGFIFTGIMTLAGLALFPLMTFTFNNTPGFGDAGGVFGWAFGISTAVYVLGLGVLYFFLSFFIYKFGDKIRSYLRTGAESDLETALYNNSRLWKMLGIIFIAGLAIFPLMIIISIITVVTTVFN